MLKAITDRYGAATDRALLGVTNGTGRVTWPGRVAYDTDVSIFVGPDAARWVWCAPPPGQLNLPGDFRVEGTRVEGRTASGLVFAPVECAPSALSHAPDTGTRVLLLIEGPEFTLAHKASEAAPAQIEWTLLNAVFDGIEWSPDPAAGAHAQRIDGFSFANGARQWRLQFLQAHRDPDRDNLSNGLIQRLPTATLMTAVDNLAQLPDAEAEAFAITRLLSLATGSSVGGARRRVIQTGATVEETYMDWPIFGTAYHYNNHALICNCPQMGGALREFMGVAVAPFRTQDTQLALATVINYLEQARSNNVADIRIALCVLALEALTHRLCLRDGLTEKQLLTMNIQQKLNRARNNMGMGFIEKKFAEEARETVRNPLVHTGQIPGLSIQEKVEWYDDLYALAFKMLLFLLGYKGRWFDLSDQWKVVNAP